MGYFEDMTTLDENIQINGVTMPETSVPVSVEFQNISDGGRLADGLDFEGQLQGVKVTITLKYNQLNKEHYDRIFKATEDMYLKGGDFFMNIKVPTYTPLGIQTFRGYFGSTHSPNCVDTTEKLRKHNPEYGIGGSLYDELHEDVEFKFVQK